MKQLLCFVLFLLPVIAFAQGQPHNNPIQRSNENALVDDPLLKQPTEKILPPPNTGDANPTFPGTYSSATNETQYYSDNIKYPADALAAHLTGVVKLSSVIDADGNVTEIKVVRSLSPSTDAEAMRLVALPKWIPAKKNDKYVKAQWHHEVYFRL